MATTFERTPRYIDLNVDEATVGVFLQFGTGRICVIEGTFISLVGRLLLSGQQKRLAIPKYESSASLITSKALNYMQDRLSEKLTLEEIAKAAVSAARTSFASSLKQQVKVCMPPD